MRTRSLASSAASASGESFHCGTMNLPEGPMRMTWERPLEGEPFLRMRTNAGELVVPFSVMGELGAGMHEALSHAKDHAKRG